MQTKDNKVLCLGTKLSTVIYNTPKRKNAKKYKVKGWAVGARLSTVIHFSILMCHSPLFVQELQVHHEGGEHETQPGENTQHH